MAENRHEDTSRFSRISQILLWVDKPGSADRLIKVLAVVCILLFLADFTYHKHAYVSVENIPGFYGIYGFVMFTGLILVAKLLRVIIKRPENYYEPKSVDTEEYPDNELEKVDHDAA